MSDQAAEQSAREELVLSQVLASFEGCENDRLRTLMQALARHAHHFIREVALTEAEWEAAIAFLRACGDITNDARQEFVLLSDVLGLSMQTICVNNPADGEATEATVFGPFFVEGSPHIELGGDITQGAPGEPCWISGTVRDSTGAPVAGARIEVWETDADGYYDVQYDDDRVQGRGHLFTDDQGAYRFWAITPTPYPIPHDGPVGRLLQATGRSPLRASHVHFMVTAPGHRRLVTHIFVDGDPHLADDAVFGVKPSLIKSFTRHRTPAPDGRPIDGTWSQVTFDIVLAPAPASRSTGQLPHSS